MRDACCVRTSKLCVVGSFRQTLSSMVYYHPIPTSYKHGIPKILHARGLTICRLFYCPDYIPTKIARNFTNDRSHVLYLPTQLRFDQRPRQGLWWCATPNTNLDKKKVLRSYYIRRLRLAIRGALEEKGYDEMGNNVAECGNPLKLRGTLDIQALSPLYEAKNLEIKQQAAIIVGSVMRSCEWYSKGSRSMSRWT